MKRGLRLFGIYVLIAVITILFAEAAFWTKGYSYIEDQSEQSSIRQAELICDLYAAGQYGSLAENREFVRFYADKYDIRITLIAADGDVVADSGSDPVSMENHKDRDEVQRALQGETGTSTRNSHTLGVGSFYVAVPVSTASFEGVLRISVPLEALADLNRELIRQIILTLLSGVLLVIGFLALLSRREKEEHQGTEDHRSAEGRAAAQCLPFPDRNFKRGMEDVDQIDSIVINKTTRMVTVGDRPVSLSKKEFELLCLMSSNRGRVFSREVLLEKIWGYDYYGETRTVDVHIRNLRKKIERDSEHPEYIITVRGYGYKFV